MINEIRRVYHNAKFSILPSSKDAVLLVILSVRFQKNNNWSCPSQNGRKFLKAEAKFEILKKSVMEKFFFPQLVRQHSVKGLKKVASII